MNLTLKADKPGRIENVLLVRGDGNLIAKDVYPLEVIAPALEVTLSGPKLRYLEREATYDVAIANPGTAPAKDIELVTYLPKGMKFVSADHKGKYEAQNHAVYWSLEELPAGQNGLAKLCVLPTETGEQKLRGRPRGDGPATCVPQVRPSRQSGRTAVLGEGRRRSHRSRHGHDVCHHAYQHRVERIDQHPAGGRPADAAPTDRRGRADPRRHRTRPGRGRSAGTAGTGESATYKLRVHGLEAGTHRIQVQLVTEETPTPVTREELTRVYADK